ncbi:ATP-binding protein [Steroidobacter flavus]|uniref:histidine kinase n=1 Tax=Steroidobacter flavus TaxID=1842136 RepID=A0ABV8SZR8_9GAMM
MAVGADSRAEHVMQAGKRIADLLAAPWTLVFVETPDLLQRPSSSRDGWTELQRLAGTLGAQAVTLDGQSAAEALLDYARTSEATHIVIGAPRRKGLLASLRPSTASRLVREARHFDVITIGSAHGERSGTRSRDSSKASWLKSIRWSRYGWALAISALTSALLYALDPYVAVANIIMSYLASSTFVAVKFGRGPAVLASFANVAAFAVYFVPPRFSVTMVDLQYLVTFTVMLIVAVTMANLIASVRRQSRATGDRERRTALLYAMTRDLSATRGVANMSRVAVRHIVDVFDCQAAVLLPDATGTLQRPADAPMDGSFRNADLSVAQWVFEHGPRGGLGSDYMPEAPAMYLLLTHEQQRFGVLAVLPQTSRRLLAPEQTRLLDSFAEQLSLAVERAGLSAAAEAGRVAAETESLRNTLLASISHDLRTPLAAIAGASSTLAERGREIDDDIRTQLARSIEAKAVEMAEIVSNVLDLMRFESGQIALRRDTHALDDLIGSALVRVEERLRSHPVRIDVPNELPVLHVDGTLIVQALANIFDNAAKYTPADAVLHIGARLEEQRVRVEIDDEGPGFPAVDRERLFDKFSRGQGEGAVAGAGLGLAICRAIVHAHGGTIRATDRPGGGARVEFFLPTTAGSL